MQYVNLGKSGLKVSRLCLGMMTYGSKNGVVGSWRKMGMENKKEAGHKDRPLFCSWQHIDLLF